MLVNSHRINPFALLDDGDGNYVNLHILSFLSHADLVFRVSLVSKYLNTLANDQILWKERVIRLLGKDENAIQKSFNETKDWKISFLLGPNGQIFTLNNGKGNFAGMRMTRQGIKEEGAFQNYFLVKGKKIYPLNEFYENSEIQEGDFQYGKLHGRGKHTYPNGYVYEGDFQYGKRHGKGKYIDAYGDVYEGDFENDVEHGKGKYIDANGLYTYEGELQNGEKHGKGKLAYTNGDVYEGDFQDNIKHGKGKLTYANGDIYEGDFQNDMRHGKGKITYANGVVYRGDFQNDMRHGKGKITYANGAVYRGYFQNDKPYVKTNSFMPITIFIKAIFKRL
jgi:hypothetical protein